MILASTGLPSRGQKAFEFFADFFWAPLAFLQIFGAALGASGHTFPLPPRWRKRRGCCAPPAPPPPCRSAPKFASAQGHRFRPVFIATTSPLLLGFRSPIAAATRLPMWSDARRSGS